MREMLHSYQHRFAQARRCKYSLAFEFVFSLLLQESAANGEPVALEVFILSRFLSACLSSPCGNVEIRQLVRCPTSTMAKRRSPTLKLSCGEI